MRNLWALVALSRLAGASVNPFSVLDDLLTYPQYEIVFSDDVIVADDPKSLTKPGITLTTTPLPNYSQPASHEDEESPVEPEVREYELMNLRGIEYLCSIPVAKAQNETKEELSPEEESKELVRATARGWELLKDMEGQCIYFVSGWWSYSFCFNEGVRQFHQLPSERGGPAYPPVEDPSVDSYILGVFPDQSDSKRRTASRHQDENSQVAKLETRGKTRYLVQKLGGGTECELIGRERRIELQFHCSPQTTDHIGLIKEVATCSYLMVINTPRLCNDVAFLPPKLEHPNPIKCRAILADRDLKEFEAIQKEEDNSRATSPAVALKALEQALPSYPVVGGVQIGARKWVGTEGKVIERGEILGGNKGTFVATVASSAGVELSAAELKKLNIPSKADLETMKMAVSRAAREHEWRIDLYDTRRGFEYRAEIKRKKTGEEEEKGEEKKSENGDRIGKEKAGNKDSKTFKDEEDDDGRYKEEL